MIRISFSLLISVGLQQGKNDFKIFLQSTLSCEMEWISAPLSFGLGVQKRTNLLVLVIITAKKSNFKGKFRGSSKNARLSSELICMNGNRMKLHPLGSVRMLHWYLTCTDAKQRNKNKNKSIKLPGTLITCSSCVKSEVAVLCDFSFGESLFSLWSLSFL